MAAEASGRMSASVSDAVPGDGGQPVVSFATSPAAYRHWKLSVDGRVATMAMDVDERGGLVPGYTLKLNSYDLGVDVELHDAIQRLRFEHPEVGAVIVTSAKDRCFCAGANIGMLAQSEHSWKVNFCKFTNETRLEMEDASANSGQVYLAAVNGAAAGGGYELALACEEILLIDDGSSAVALPELPLLAVLPATGGLTRVVDKRHVRRDLADAFATRTEGVKAGAAVRWGLVDAAVPRARFEDEVQERARRLAAAQPQRATSGVTLDPLLRSMRDDGVDYEHVHAQLDRGAGVATFVVEGPAAPPPPTAAAARELGCRYWPLAVARELDDLILHLRVNEVGVGTWVFKTVGDVDTTLAHDRFLRANREPDWFINEVALFLKRVFKRLEVTSRSLVAVIEPGSCFAGVLLELALACDRQYMLDGTLDDGAKPATIVVGDTNAGVFPMGNGLSRLESRFFGHPDLLQTALARTGEPLDAVAAMECGLVTFAPDGIDWPDELRIALEERRSFSPDALSGMEANFRFVGPETMETKIFGRLTAWQNWIFNRPNASGPAGALQRYGSGQRPVFDRERV